MVNFAHIAIILLPVKTSGTATEYTVADREEVSHAATEMGRQS